MKITFHHPSTGTLNQFADFRPGNIQHYPKEAGIYIYGFKKLIENKTVFIPIYVGIAQDLSARLWQHYCEERSFGNSKWYLFDYAGLSTLKDVQNLYKDMKIADSKKGLNPIRYSEKLIWFNHSSFFDAKLELPGGSSYVSNMGVLSSILPNGDLDNMTMHNPASAANKLKQSILASKAIFDNHFYFIYASLESDVMIGPEHALYKEFSDYLLNKQYMKGRKNGPGRNIAESIEIATKKLLDKVNLYTSAKAHGKFHEMELNLSEVQSVLVNTGIHPYNQSAGQYLNTLTITK